MSEKKEEQLENFTVGKNYFWDPNINDFREATEDEVNGLFGAVDSKLKVTKVDKEKGIITLESMDD